MEYSRANKYAVTNETPLQSFETKSNTFAVLLRTCHSRCPIHHLHPFIHLWEIAEVPLHPLPIRWPPTTRFPIKHAYRARIPFISYNNVPRGDVSVCKHGLLYLFVGVPACRSMITGVSKHTMHVGSTECEPE